MNILQHYIQCVATNVPPTLLSAGYIKGKKYNWERVYAEEFEKHFCNFVKSGNLRHTKGGAVLYVLPTHGPRQIIEFEHYTLNQPPKLEILKKKEDVFVKIVVIDEAISLDDSYELKYDKDYVDIKYYLRYVGKKKLANSLIKHEGMLVELKKKRFISYNNYCILLW